MQYKALSGRGISCYIQVTVMIMDTQEDLKALLLKSWIMAQTHDYTIREIKFYMSDYSLAGQRVNSKDSMPLKKYLCQCSHLLI